MECPFELDFGSLLRTMHPLNHLFLKLKLIQATLSFKLQVSWKTWVTLGPWGLEFETCSVRQLQFYTYSYQIWCRWIMSQETKKKNNLKELSRTWELHSKPLCKHEFYTLRTLCFWGFAPTDLPLSLSPIKDPSD